MKHRVKIEVPLSGMSAEGEIITDTFTIQPPCFYCGKPIAPDHDGYFDLKDVYPIKFWGYTQESHKPRLGHVIDAHGNIVRGSFRVKIPYCPDHIKPVRTFTIIDILAISSGTLLGLVLTAIFGVDRLSSTPLVLAFILIPLAAAGLFYVMGTAIKRVIPKLCPRLKDYASHKGHYGICSHGVRVDGGQPMQGPMTYWLQLAFCSPASAERFIASNPTAKVIQGNRYLEEGI